MFQVLVANLGLDPERVQPIQMCVPTLTWNISCPRISQINWFNIINEKKIENPGNCDLRFILNLVILGPTKWIFFLIFSKIWDVFWTVHLLLCLHSKVHFQITNEPEPETQLLHHEKQCFHALQGKHSIPNFQEDTCAALYPWDMSQSTLMQLIAPTF